MRAQSVSRSLACNQEELRRVIASTRERESVCVNVKREREFVDKSRGERRNYVEHCALNFKVRRGNSTIRLIFLLKSTSLFRYQSN